MDLVGNVHLIAGTSESVPEILGLLRAMGMQIDGSPDLYIRTYPAFGIDEARDLRARAGSRAIFGDRRAFIIVAPTLTNDAQNALLKTLEEPPADALFFFIVPAPQMLLPTLRSRAQILQLTAVRSEELVDTKTFLRSSAQKRLDMLRPLLEKDADDKRDLGAILAFLGALERRLEKHPAGLTALYRARKYIGDRGALVKPLLEQVALLVPEVV